MPQDWRTGICAAAIRNVGKHNGRSRGRRKEEGRSNLVYADLSKATLIGADLTDADLTLADLSESTFDCDSIKTASLDNASQFHITENGTQVEVSSC
jgi:Pentapeptide repeats (8 copies)